jgi:hypothetical protein
MSCIVIPILCSRIMMDNAIENNLDMGVKIAISSN